MRWRLPAANTSATSLWQAQTKTHVAETPWIFLKSFTFLLSFPPVITMLFFQATQPNSAHLSLLGSWQAELRLSLSVMKRVEFLLVGSEQNPDLVLCWKSNTEILSMKWSSASHPPTVTKTCENLTIAFSERCCNVWIEREPIFERLSNFAKIWNAA